MQSVSELNVIVSKRAPHDPCVCRSSWNLFGRQGNDPPRLRRGVPILFMSQSNNRIDSHRAACRYQTTQRSGDHQHGGGDDECDRISG
jgi:hypothetical protein